MDSAVRHGDVLGEYDRCVTVWLVGGAVVHQGQAILHTIYMISSTLCRGVPGADTLPPGVQGRVEPPPRTQVETGE